MKLNPFERRVRAGRRLSALCLSFVLFFSLSACASPESSAGIVSHPPLSTEASRWEPYYTVNIDSKTLHTDPDCAALAAGKSENLRRVATDNATLDLLFTMGYHLCGNCAPNEERNQ